jgi:hypothetical protein
MGTWNGATREVALELVGISGIRPRHEGVRGVAYARLVLWLVWLEELPLLLGDPPTVSVARGYTRGKMRECLACHRPRVLYTCGATGHQTTKQQPHQLILRQYEPNPKAKTPTRNVFNRVCAILERVILPQTRNPH